MVCNDSDSGKGVLFCFVFWLVGLFLIFQYVSLVLRGSNPLLEVSFLKNLKSVV